MRGNNIYDLTVGWDRMKIQKWAAIFLEVAIGRSESDKRLKLVRNRRIDRRSGRIVPRDSPGGFQCPVNCDLIPCKARDFVLQNACSV